MNLWDKIQKIEALIASSSSQGEVTAARLAKERLLERENSAPKEYKISFSSPWEKRLFNAIAKKYGYDCYRYYRQRSSTTCIKSPKQTMEQVLWPEYLKFARELNDLLASITEDIIHKVYAGDITEKEVVGELENSSQACIL